MAKSKSGINIKKSHKGEFTAKAKKAGMSVQAFASHVHAHPEKYSASTRKQANFAKNAKKWKHQAGGGANNIPDVAGAFGPAPSQANGLSFNNIDTPGPVNQDQIIERYKKMGYNVTIDPNTGKMKVSRQGGFGSSPIVKDFNIAAGAATAIGSTINNNKLRKQERLQMIQSQNPAYMENYEAQGLNPIPAYTQYGGKRRYSVFDRTNMDDEMDQGFAHKAFYGSDSIYKAGGLTKEKAKEILRDGTVHGQPLTDKQKRYFGYIAGGGKAQFGGDTHPFYHEGRFARHHMPKGYVPDYPQPPIENNRFQPVVRRSRLDRLEEQNRLEEQQFQNAIRQPQAPQMFRPIDQTDATYVRSGRALYGGGEMGEIYRAGSHSSSVNRRPTSYGMGDLYQIGYYQTGGAPNPLSSPVNAMNNPNAQIFNSNSNDPFVQNLDDLDYINYAAGKGVNPYFDEHAKNTIGKDPRLGNKFLTSLAAFSARDDIKNMSPEQRVRTYFSLNENNPEVNKYKQRLNAMSHDAVSQFKQTSDAENQALQGNALGNRTALVRMFGGDDSNAMFKGTIPKKKGKVMQHSQTWDPQTFAIGDELEMGYEQLNTDYIHQAGGMASSYGGDFGLGDTIEISLDAMAELTKKGYKFKKIK